MSEGLTRLLHRTASPPVSSITVGRQVPHKEAMTERPRVRLTLPSMYDGSARSEVVGLSGVVSPASPMKPEEIALWSRVARYQFVYSLVGLIVGLGVVLVGSALFLRGIAGNASWTARILGFESAISDAGPGALLFVVGIFIVWSTRFEFKVKHGPQRRPDRRKARQSPRTEE